MDKTVVPRTQLGATNIVDATQKCTNKVNGTHVLI